MPQVVGDLPGDVIEVAALGDSTALLGLRAATSSALPTTASSG